MTAYLFIGLFTASTYVLGGIAREQVCIYMCPWPRIQGAMFDRDSLLISYREWRGEPRGPHKFGQSWEGRGDCIDCRQCVAVCPTGIDIRNGPQLECIQCALCIDACNAIMDKVGRPSNLIAYDTLRDLEAGSGAEPIRLMRPRVILYATAMVVVGLIMLVALAVRPELDVNVLHDRNPLYVKLSDGGVRNGYTIKLLNKIYTPRAFKLSVEGLPGAKLDVVGHEGGVVPVPPDNLQSVKLYITLDKQAAGALPDQATDFDFVITDIASGAGTEHKATFQGPPR
jgi:cytochrome c oxidase accessory protein FixG